MRALYPDWPSKARACRWISGSVDGRESFPFNSIGLIITVTPAEITYRNEITKYRAVRREAPADGLQSNSEYGISFLPDSSNSEKVSGFFGVIFYRKRPHSCRSPSVHGKHTRRARLLQRETPEIMPLVGRLRCFFIARGLLLPPRARIFPAVVDPPVLTGRLADEAF